MSGSKPILNAVLRYGLCLAAIYVALRGVAWNELLRIAVQAETSALAAALGVFLIVPLLQAVRLRWLLAAQGIRMGLSESVRLTFCGNLMNFAAPLGSTAGDVYKAWQVAQRSSQRTEAASIVLLDRVVGLATLLLSVGAIALLAGPDSRLGLLRPMLMTLSAGLVLAAGVYAAPGWRDLPVVRRLTAHLPQRPRLERIDHTARRLLCSPGALLRAVLITLVLQIAAAASFVCVAAAMGMHVLAAQPLDLYAHFSAGEIVKALPGPPQGLGTMELTYSYFFAGLGAPSQVVCAALGVRVVNLACALPGAWLMLTGRPRATPAPRLHAPECAVAVRCTAP